VLINPEKSIFDTPSETIVMRDGGPRKHWIKALIPEMGHNLNAGRGFVMFKNEIKRRTDGQATVLVIGAGQGGLGTSDLYNDQAIKTINSDILPSANLDIIADAHYLPIADSSCDGVVIQAVLEHVLDPAGVVAEIHRVLKPGGVVYAETPFMQMVHERAYDYTRFTDLGHRNLFKYFSEIDRGITGGAGMSLAWAWCYFLRAFTSGKRSALAAVVLGRFMTFPLLFIDGWLAQKPGSYDACSGCYFLGTKSDRPITHTQLVESFRGI
jgi:SAM-dependent methyltransferase